MLTFSAVDFRMHLCTKFSPGSSPPNSKGKSSGGRNFEVMGTIGMQVTTTGLLLRGFSNKKELQKQESPSDTNNSRNWWKFVDWKISLIELFFFKCKKKKKKKQLKTKNKNRGPESFGKRSQGTETTESICESVNMVDHSVTRAKDNRPLPVLRFFLVLLCEGVFLWQFSDCDALGNR